MTSCAQSATFSSVLGTCCRSSSEALRKEGPVGVRAGVSLAPSTRAVTESAAPAGAEDSGMGRV